jgi:hypothetical protein
MHVSNRFFLTHQKFNNTLLPPDIDGADIFNDCYRNVTWEDDVTMTIRGGKDKTLYCTSKNASNKYSMLTNWEALLLK